jgi:hypothetical protein
MTKKTPIAVFVYNRPEQARKMLQSLAECDRVGECAITIFSDGPRHPDHAHKVAEVRMLIRGWADTHDAEIIERPRNLGLAHSIVAGVNRLCGESGRVIVVEDDLILHHYFLDFMLQSLDRYDDNERVAQIAGFTFPVSMSPETDAFFLPIISSWGWATWQRAWSLFSWDTEIAVRALNDHPALQSRFDLDGAYHFSDILRLTHEEKIDSWAIRWYWINFSRNTLTLYPYPSLVWQNGFEENATHTKAKNPGMQPPIKKFLTTRWNSPVVFPDTVQLNEAAVENLKAYYFRQVSRSLKNRLRRKLRKLFTEKT